MTRRGALAAAALLAGVRWAAADPVLSVITPPVDAGRVEHTAAATATVQIANAGSGTLKLLALQLLDGGTGAAADWTLTPGAPCGPTVPPTCALTEGAGASVSLQLRFAPRSIGVRDATLLVNYHDTADRSISIPLRGVGVGPTLEILGAPAMLDFGTLPVGVAGKLTLDVTNHGTRSLGDGALAIDPPGAPFSGGTGSLTVSTAAATPITITCTPTAADTFTANLELSAPDVPGPPIRIGLRCAGDPAQVLVATPPAILLGEVRLGVPAMAHVRIDPASAALAGAALSPAIPGVTVTGIPPTTPTIDLTAAPRAEGILDSQLTVMPRTGAPLAIAMTGRAVIASVTPPTAVSLGTFCVHQPTTPRIVALSSTGSATVALSAPALGAMSPFDLERVAPLDYPNILPPTQRAFVAVTPRPRDVAGVASDDLVWTTDAGPAPLHTALTATFLADGGAIAPGALAFGQVPIHVDTNNAQQVTLQNCSAAAFQLDPPQVPAPFSIDSPNFPTALKPGEIATFSVGFHPTQDKPVMKTLIITSPQLPAPLRVDLTGEGITTGGETTSGSAGGGAAATSFYACGGCTTGDPSGALAIGLAALAAVAPRRRRVR